MISDKNKSYLIVTQGVESGTLDCPTMKVRDTKMNYGIILGNTGHVGTLLLICAPPPPACAPGGRRSHQPVGTPLCLKNSQSGQKTTCSWGPFMITKMQAPCGSCEYMSLPSNPGSKVLAIHRTFSSLQVKIKQLPVSWRALVSTSSMAKFVETTTSTQRKRVLFGKGRY